MELKTESICPVCLKIVPALKIKKGRDIVLEKACPEHGTFSAIIAKDAQRFLDKTFDVEGQAFQPITEYKGECGSDCGWCGEHRQHICTGLIEVTEDCNLRCPVCYFGKKTPEHISLEEFQRRLDALLTVEKGHLDVLQLSGGECLIHPKFDELLNAALKADVGRVLINTNGLALLDDEKLFALIKDHRDRVEVYLQFDGFDDEVYKALRGRPLLKEKLSLIEKLNAAEVKICLAVTVYQGNLKEIPKILDLSVKTKHISGITFQRLTKVGSAKDSSLPSVFQEDILLAIAGSNLMAYKDLIPLPCSHPNCTSLGFLFCQGDKVYSLGDYVDFTKCKGTISNRIAFDKTILDYMKKNVCKCFVGKVLGSSFMLEKLQEFAEGDGSVHKDMKIVRIIVKNFMDIDNFDWERAKKCCTGVSVGKGKVIPFCVHNLLRSKMEQ